MCPDSVEYRSTTAVVSPGWSAWGADTKHIPSKRFETPMNTNIIEGFHGTLKDRTKVMRGLRKIKTVRILLDGWLVHYNFFRPHESLGDKTPAQKAVVRLQLPKLFKIPDVRLISILY